MDHSNNRLSRALTSEEERILRLVQEIYGSRNTPDKCFTTDEKEVAIFAEDSNGDPVILVNLTFLADLSLEQGLKDEVIKEKWLNI
jgi:hypothetical protein